MSSSASLFWHDGEVWGGVLSGAAKEAGAAENTQNGGKEQSGSRVRGDRPGASAPGAQEKMREPRMGDEK